MLSSQPEHFLNSDSISASSIRLRFTADPETNENEFFFPPDPKKEKHGLHASADGRHKSWCVFRFGIR
jgi:hypothetical protein